MSEKRIIKESIFIITVMILVLMIQVVAVLEVRDANNALRITATDTRQAWTFVFLFMMLVQAFLTSSLVSYYKEFRGLN